MEEEEEDDDVLLHVASALTMCSPLHNFLTDTGTVPAQSYAQHIRMHTKDVCCKLYLVSCRGCLQLGSRICLRDCKDLPVSKETFPFPGVVVLQLVLPNLIRHFPCKREAQCTP